MQPRPRSLAEARMQAAAARARLRLLVRSNPIELRSVVGRQSLPWLLMGAVAAGAALLKIVPLRTAAVALVAKYLLGDEKKD